MKLPALCAFVVLAVSALHAQAPVTPRPEDAAKEAVAPWLALLDDGKYAESWNAAAPTIQKLVPLDRWTKAMVAVRTPFGKVVNRAVASAKFTASMPGAPSGQYVIIEFHTVFENKPSAVETVTPEREADGSWKVAGYYIK